MKFQYELLIDRQIPYLVYIKNKNIKYQIIGVSDDQKRIKIKSTTFDDIINIYIKDIKNFNHNTIIDIYPEWYI